MTKEDVHEDHSGPAAPDMQEEDERARTAHPREGSVRILTVCFNTCWGGAQKRETDFLSVILDARTGDHGHEFKYSKLFKGKQNKISLLYSCQTLEEATLRCCDIFILEDGT